MMPMPEPEFEVDQLEAQLAEMLELDPAELVDQAGALAETLTVALDALDEELPA